jgi:hypothetical protein
MTLKQKIFKATASYPKLVTFGIVFGITFLIGIAFGTIVQPHQALATHGLSWDG